MPTVGIATGAGRGMGLACAARLTDMVDRLVLVDRDEASVSEAAQVLSRSGGTTVEPFVLDITDRDGLDRLATRVSQLGSLRAVAHAAGISPTMAEWRRIFAVEMVQAPSTLDSWSACVTRWVRPCRCPALRASRSGPTGCRRRPDLRSVTRHHRYPSGPTGGREPSGHGGDGPADPTGPGGSVRGSGRRRHLPPLRSGQFHQRHRSPGGRRRRRLGAGPAGRRLAA